MKSVICTVVILLSAFHAFPQVDTSYIYNPDMPYGTLDIRIARSVTEYYYLEQSRTFAFRHKDGSQTNSYLDMTAWDSSPYQQGHMRKMIDSGDQFVMNYRLLVPQNYDSAYAAGYPLVLFLHGAMERGNCNGTNCYHANSHYSPDDNNPPAPVSADHKLLNNDYNLVHGGSNYLEAHNVSGSQLPDDPALDARAFPGFALFPQNLNGWNPGSAEDAIRLVRLIAREYNIDENRIYLNGVSHGGQGAYEVMKRAPWLFAAAILFSAADDAQVIKEDMANKIAGIPIWMFQGGQDRDPSPKETEGYIKALRSAGATIRYTLYPELGHGTWNKAFAEPDFFSWMLRQKNNDIHVFAGNAAICKPSGEGAVLKLPDGFVSYQWERDGQLIDDADSASYIATMPGYYRARFSAVMPDGTQEWTDWSALVTVTEKDPPPATLKQIGTVVLKDPNGMSNAMLQSDGPYAHYYWYRNGALVNLPGNQDDTVRTAIFGPENGNGVYTLKVAGYDNCNSPPSEEKVVFFDDSAPVNISAPTGLAVENISASEVSLTWNDVSDNEHGFEVWRRQRIDEGKFDPWQMATLTLDNIDSFADESVLPSSTYEYMIRAVSTLGRSLYYPDSTAGAVTITTVPDKEPPSAPDGLVAAQVGVETVSLNWRPASDNSSVREYVVYFNDDTIVTNSNDTVFMINEIHVNTMYSFVVRAVDIGNNMSDPSNKAKIYTSVNGLFYEHSTGAWQGLDEIDWTIAEFKGVVDRFTLDPKTQEDFFNFRFDGYVHLKKEGVYQFRISSNDGSRLSLDDSLLVENDGVHNFTPVTGPIQILSEGPHRITVDFFDFSESDSLLVEYKGPDSGDEWLEIPPEILTSELVTSVELAKEADFDFAIFPNPTHYNNINLKVASDNVFPLSIRIHDMAGDQLYRADLEFKESLPIRITDHIAGGMYIISIEQRGRVRTKKILIR